MQADALLKSTQLYINDKGYRKVRKSNKDSRELNIKEVSQELNVSDLSKYSSQQVRLFEIKLSRLTMNILEFPFWSKML